MSPTTYCDKRLIESAHPDTSCRAGRAPAVMCPTTPKPEVGCPSEQEKAERSGPCGERDQSCASRTLMEESLGVLLTAPPVSSVLSGVRRRRIGARRGSLSRGTGLGSTSSGTAVRGTIPDGLVRRDQPPGRSAGSATGK